VVNKDWLDIGVLEDYLDGKLDAKTMNRVEREALEDPFVAEALAGLSESPKRSLQSISLLQKQLHERIAEHQSVKKTSIITWQRLSIAATAAVMFVAVSIMFWMRENNHQKELAGRAKKVDVTIAPKAGDTVPAVIETAPVLAAESADKQTEKEIDKAIKAAKTNTYAARVKPRTKVASSAVDVAQPLKEVVISAAPAQFKRQAVASMSVVSVAPLQSTLNGKVVDERGQALPGVSVQVVGTNLSTVTNAEGMFKIAADTLIKEGTIRVNYIGFKAAEVLAKVNQPVAVALEPDGLALNEVVIVGYGKAKKEQIVGSAKLNEALSGRVGGIVIRGSSSVNKSTMVSSPVGGWDKLFAYIKANNVFEKETKTGQAVELSFKIDKDGTPTAIEIIKVADDKYEQEAIRLILNGPKWEKPAKENSRVTFKINF
jgi:hypothetical protein